MSKRGFGHLVQRCRSRMRVRMVGGESTRSLGLGSSEQVSALQKSRLSIRRRKFTPKDTGIVLWYSSDEKTKFARGWRVFEKVVIGDSVNGFYRKCSVASFDRLNLNCEYS